MKIPPSPLVVKTVQRVHIKILPSLLVVKTVQQDILTIWKVRVAAKRVKPVIIRLLQDKRAVHSVLLEKALLVMLKQHPTIV